MSARGDDGPGPRPPTLPARPSAPSAPPAAGAPLPAPSPPPAVMGSAASSGERLAVRIPGYKLEGMLGRGGMGIVYRARQLSIDRPVAVKILPVRASKRPRFVERFLTEARAVARLNHPNVVQAIDAGQAGEVVYFVMELIDGETVGQRIEREGALPVKDAVHILLGVARALDHACKHGLVHRDVKPDNVLLARDGRVLLCDLGLARLGATINQDGPVERSDVAEGTPAYISPEQARGFTDVDIRADLYSLGVTAFHLLTGDLPFEGDAAEIMRQHVYTDFPDIQRRRRDLPRELVELIARLVEKEPADRPEDPAEVVRVLARLQTRLARGGGHARGRRERAGDESSSDSDDDAAAAHAGAGASAGAGDGGSAAEWAAAAASVGAALLTWWLLFRGPFAPAPRGPEGPAGGAGAAAGPAPGAVAAGRSGPPSGGEGAGVAPAADSGDALPLRERVAESARAADASIRLAPLAEQARLLVEIRAAPPRLIEALRALASSYPGTPAAAEAERWVGALARAAEDAFVERLERLRPRLDDLLAAGRFGQAHAELEVLAGSADAVDGARPGLEAARADVEGACAKAYAEVERAADDLVRAGRSAAALERLRRFAEDATPAVRARAERRIEAVERAAREAGAEVGRAGASPEGAAGGARSGEAGGAGLAGPGGAGGGGGSGGADEPPRDGVGGGASAAGAAAAPAAPTDDAASAAAGEAARAAAATAAARALHDEARRLLAAGEARAALERLDRLARAARSGAGPAAPGSAGPGSAAAGASPEDAAARAYVRAARADLRALATEARAAEHLAGPRQAFFAGRVEEQKGGAVRVIYSAAAPGGLDDWRPATGADGEGLERSSARAADGSWALEGRVAWRGRLAGEGALEVVLEEGEAAKSFALALRDDGHLRGLAGAVALTGSDEIFALAPRGPLRGSLPPGATFKLPGHVLARARGSLEEAEFLAFAKGPPLPAGPARVALREEGGRLRLAFGPSGVLEAPAPPGASGEGVSVWAGQPVRVQAIVVTGALSPRWLAAEARARGERDAKALFPE